MSWVLILNSDVVAKPPAIIGGYATREEAETAGDLATDFSNLPEFASPYYISYSVIPGAAAVGPSGGTFSSVAREWGGTCVWQRYTRKW
jgi:hypothetical protein